MRVQHVAQHQLEANLVRVRTSEERSYDQCRTHFVPHKMDNSSVATATAADHHPLVGTSDQYTVAAASASAQAGAGSSAGTVVITAASGAGVSYQVSAARSSPLVVENLKNGGAGIQQGASLAVK